MTKNSEAEMIGSSSSSSTQQRSTGRGKAMDSVFVLDCSRSMGERLEGTTISKIEIAKTALVSTFTRAAETGCPDRIALLAVSTNIFAKPIIREIVPFGEVSHQETDSTRSIPIEDIVSLKCQGGTALYAAISHGVHLLLSNRGNKPNGQQIVIVTDSKNNTAEQPMKVLSHAAQNRVRISVIDLANPKVKDSLKMISDATGGRFALVANAKGLTSALSSAFTVPTPPISSQYRPEVQDGRNGGAGSSRILLPPIMGQALRPPVTPKKSKPESVDQIKSRIDQIRQDLENLTDSLRSGKISQMQFSEKYSILEFDLQSLRDSIREQRSKVNRELAEYAVSQGRMSSTSSALNEEKNERLLELDHQIEILKQSASYVSEQT